jgi:alcohol dehydrogenase class IV|tara:strand:+ start:1565 stop:2719 length:1155 start_codon:yes stop_codon:yes gene_type:complete
MKFNWNYPTTVWVGKNRIDDLASACENLNIKNPLLVTDKDLIELPFIKNILASLKKKFSQLRVFSNFSGNPIGENVEEGVEIFKKNNNDGVVTIGGGSALDVGKAIAFMSAQTRPIWDFEDIGDYWKRANNNISPIIAIPTTAGTGSETGRASAIINKKTGVKKIIFHPKFLPSIVILDPMLTVDLSPRLTAATGMDALAHNLEAFCAPGFHPMADGIALEGIKLIKTSLITAFNDGRNIEARQNLLAASSMGSTAFQKGLGAIHSLSHPVNSKFNMHHGLSNAIFMPYVLTFNKKFIEKRISTISSFIGLENNFKSFLDWIITLRKELKIPHKLSELIQINSDQIEELSQMALEDPSTATNPSKLKKEDFKKMYEYSIEGKLF